jgi:hypothetical protein
MRSKMGGVKTYTNTLCDDVCYPRHNPYCVFTGTNTIALYFFHDIAVFTKNTKSENAL